MLRRQGGGDDDGVHLALQQVLDTAHFVVRLIFGTGDQQLVTTLARLAFQVVGDAGIAGIFQIRDHQTDRTGTPGAQPRRDGIRVIVMLPDHGHHFLDGFIADTILLRLAVDDVTGRRARNARETRDFIQFHINPLMTLKIEVKAVLGLTMASRAVIQSSLCDLTAENTA